MKQSSHGLCLELQFIYFWCVMAVLVLHGSVLVTALFVCYQALECLSKGLFTASALIVVCAICSQLLCRKFGLWLRAGVKMKLEL